MQAFTLLFKALSDATRLRMLRLILAHGDRVCVCELAEALDLPQYQVSKHLSVLRQAGLVSDMRVGTWVYYRLDEANPFQKALCDLLRDTLVKEPTFRSDMERLGAALSRRRDRVC